MIIKELELENFGRHKSLKIESDGGVVGIIGANGCGKSTVLHALEYAFTGLLANPSELYIRRGADKAVVRAKFVRDGVEGEIERVIGKKSSRHLKWDGKTVKAAKEVDALMADILCADRQAVSNAVFVPQGDLDKLLFGSASEREQLLIRLMGLSHLEKHAAVVEGKIKVLSSTLQDFGAAMDMARSSKERAEAAVHSAFAAVGASVDHSSDIANISRWVKASQDIEERSGLYRHHVGELNRLEQSIKALLASWTGHPVEIAKAKRDEEKKLRSSAADALRRADAAKELLKVGDKFDADTKELETSKDLSASLEEVQLSLQTMKQLLDRAVKASTAFMSVENTRVRLAAAQGKYIDLQVEGLPHATEEIAASKEKVEALQAIATVLGTSYDLRLRVRNSKCEDGKCPVCDGVVDGSKFSDVQLAALKKEIDAKKAEITTLITSYKSMESANALRQTQITSAEASVKAIEADLKRVEQELSQYGLPPYGDVQELSSRVKALEEYEKTLIASISRRQQLLLSVEESKASIARWSQITNGSDTHAQAVKIMETADAVGTEAALAESAAADIAKLEAELAVVSGKLSSVGDHLENLQEEVGEIETLYPAYAGKLPDRLAELKKLQESYDMAKGALEEARKTLKAAEGEMQALEEKARKDGARRELVSDLKRLKEALGRGGVPSATVSDRFDAMAGAVAETLDSMCANFTVEPDKDSPVSFLFTRLDDESGDALPQSRLSGGQKVRLSIAFLLALHRLVVPDVGLLVLDEPSTHLDAEGVESLANMLTSLGAVMKDGGCQVFVVDHNEALTRAFTSGIKI